MVNSGWPNWKGHGSIRKGHGPISIRSMIDPGWPKWKSHCYGNDSIMEILVHNDYQNGNDSTMDWLVVWPSEWKID